MRRQHNRLMECVVGLKIFAETSTSQAWRETSHAFDAHQKSCNLVLARRPLSQRGGLEQPSHAEEHPDLCLGERCSHDVRSTLTRLDDPQRESAREGLTDRCCAHLKTSTELVDL